jgi:hypothetical protein
MAGFRSGSRSGIGRAAGRAAIMRLISVTFGSTFRLFGIGSETVLRTPCDQEREAVVLADIMRLISVNLGPDCCV